MAVSWLGLLPRTTSEAFRRRQAAVPSLTETHGCFWMVLGLEGPGKTKPEVAGKPHWDSSLRQGGERGSEGEPWVPDQVPKVT